MLLSVLTYRHFSKPEPIPPVSPQDQFQITFQELAKNDTIPINTLSYYQLKNLGASDTLVKAILKSRPFRCREKLHAVKGYLNSEVKHFEVFFHLADTCLKPTYKKPLKHTLGLNICTAKELITIKKISPKTAYRLITFRKKMGGFYSKNQLEDIYDIKKSELSLLKTQNLSRSSIKKIKINTCSAVQLSRHPYINKRQAKNMINYKKVIKKYKGKEDLYKLYLLDTNDVEKIAPYLEF